MEGKSPPLAVVTGAAGGLGSAFAKRLAERGYRLLLIDRRQEPLEQICESIAAQHSVSLDPHIADLSDREQVERLAERLQQMGIVELLVNNAGFGTVDYFVDTDVNYLLGQIDVHIVAPTILTRAVLPGMIAQNSGSIINVSSLSAWFHCAGNVQYGSTKNYLAVFSQSLQQELLGTNIRVQALCPGFVRTEFHGAESMKAFQLRRPPAPSFWMSADEVADCSLRRLAGKGVIVVPGFGYRVVSRFAQMPFLQPLMQWIARAPRSAETAQP